MATRMRKICDMHVMATDEEVEADSIPPFTLPGGKMKTLDLCEECRGIITYAYLIELGELVGADVKPRLITRAIPGKQGKKEVPEHLREKCRFCDRDDFNSQGRKMHERRAHAEELAKLEAEQAPDNAHHCEACDLTVHGDRSWKRHEESAAHKTNTKQLQDA